MTLVEIFVALGALAVLLSFAAAPLERMSARVDVDIARDNILQALNLAQQSAVRGNVPVRVYLPGNAANAPTPRVQLIAGFSPLRGEVGLFPLPHYSLPEHVRVAMSAGLSEEMSVIEYLPQGRPARDGVITLWSESNPEYVLDIEVGGKPILPAPASPRGHRGLQ